MQKFAIIVAGGKGLRMRQELPKQFLTIGGRPILMQTIQKFYDYDNSVAIIVVLSKNYLSHWQKLIEEYAFQIPFQWAEGGASRAESVRNGLAKITVEQALVAIHDGVRPLIKRQTIHQSFETASEKGSAVVVVSVKDSLREITPNGNRAVIRNNFRQVQTPQVFRLDWLKKAYEQCELSDQITDDASLMESIGFPITLIEGEYSNIKITTPEDLLLAEALWAATL